jgi:hypothetical protein
VSLLILWVSNAGLGSDHKTADWSILNSFSKSVGKPELISAIEEYIVYNNMNPEPFVWTKKAEEIIAKVSHSGCVLTNY